MIRTREKIILLLLVILFSLFHLNNFFFWDNIVQLSVPANWYFENGFSSFFLPDEIATGHPTFTGMYLTVFWKIFGKSLLVSHLSMLPIVFGLIYQIIRFVKLLVPDNVKYQWLIIIAIVADTSLMTQFSIITFEVAHLFFFFLALNEFLRNRTLVFVIAFSGLCLISLRSILSAAGIIVFLFLLHFLHVKRVTKAQFASVIPGILLFSAFLSAFYMQKGWIVHNVVSGKWANASEFSGLHDMVRNSAGFFWFILDFGRIGFFIIALVMLLKWVATIMHRNGKNKIKTFIKEFMSILQRRKEISIPVLAAIAQFMIFFPVIVFHKNTFGPRYFIPIFIPAIIAIVIWILKFSSHKRILYLTGLICLIAGHFIVYPPKMAQGWPSTTAHWPYYELRTRMLEYMNQQQIPIDKTGSFFPNTADFKYIDLKGGNISFEAIDWNRNEFIFYSNVYNVSDLAIDNLQKQDKWIPVKRLSKRNIHVVLYKRSAN